MRDPQNYRIEAGLKVTGRAIYEAETPAAQMLYASLVEAPISCGHILTIDDAQARRVDGFVDLVSYAEAEHLRPSSVTALIRDRVIHFPGQPVALLVAGTLLAARAAARMVIVKASARSPVTSMHEALDSSYAPAMVGRYPAQTRRGDPDAALAHSHLVVSGRYETSVNNHHPMEPHGVVCFWDGDRVTVHTSTQAIFGTRGVIAHAFQMPAANVRVVTRYLGGGFGCKGQLWFPWMMWAMLASKRTGRPVRLELTRAQLFTLVGRRQETLQDLSVGFDAEGKLSAIAHHVVAQTSTHAEFSDTTAVLSRRLYACANVTTSHRLVRTNEPHPIPMRAPGSAPGTFALESALDEAADQLGIDPVDLRIRNYASYDQEGDLPWSSNGLLECYRTGSERFGWFGRPIKGAISEGRLQIGWGMATTFYPVHRQACKVRVRLNPDASLLVQCGTQDMGSGTYTILGQMAADALGLSMSQVRVELGDTLLPEGPISAGSQVTGSIAPAAEVAATGLRRQIAALATTDEMSPLAGYPIDDLKFEDGMIKSLSGNAAERLDELMQRNAPNGLEHEGAASAPASSQDVSSMAYGAIFVELAVDRDLGEVRLRRVAGAFAAGKILNELLVKSQLVGGLIGGIGMALHEKTTTDKESGRIVGDNFADYLIPVHADMPDFDVVTIDENDDHLPGGVKGVGMLGTGGVQAAIANAIFNATGKRVRHLPIRIEDLFQSPSAQG